MSWMDMELELADHMTIGDVVAIMQWVLNEEQREEVAEDLCGFKWNPDEIY